ncbi:MAG TPA: hypothetical protein PKA00_16625 [Saprospiraceae bacterium]|nr:hypothetical protein [Saprospiraceae bacterium]HMQ84542.1 hypothetical protein [Saprospiraceae bacterium]
MENQVSKLQQNVWSACLILAPALIVAAQFFWKDGVVTATAGVIQVLAFTCWIFAFQGMFNALKSDMPRYAVVGFVIAVYACIGGNNFGVDGIYAEAMGITSLEEADQLIQQIGFPSAIYLFIPGTLFPLSLLLLGIQLWRTKKISTLAGLLLCVGAVCFPLSRIPRIDLLAHIDNLLLLAAHVMIALELFGKRQSAARLATI